MSGVQGSSSPKQTVTQIAVNSGLVLEDVPCDTGVVVGDFVYVDNTGKAHQAIATSSTTANILGVTISKPTTTTCNIRVSGKTAALFAGLDPSKDYFLSDTIAGGMTITPPTTNGYVMIRIGQPLSSTEFVVVKGILTIRA